MQKGLILGVHHNSPDDHFVVLLIVRRNENPPVNVEQHMAMLRKLTSTSTPDGSSVPAYKQVWWQPLTEEQS